MKDVATTGTELGAVSDPEAFLRPLDLLVADHERLAARYDTLRTLADDPYNQGYQAVAAHLLEWMEKDIALHNADEDELFSILRARCPDDHALTAMMSLLEDEHQAEEEILHGVSAGLEEIAEGKEPETPELFFGQALVFVETMRRHMAWEDRVLIPLAQERMTDSDLVALGRGMAERRGAAYPEGRARA